jgi:hypothetical protein
MNLLSVGRNWWTVVRIVMSGHQYFVLGQWKCNNESCARGRQDHIKKEWRKYEKVAVDDGLQGYPVPIIITAEVHVVIPHWVGLFEGYSNLVFSFRMARYCTVHKLYLAKLTQSNFLVVIAALITFEGKESCLFQKRLNHCKYSQDIKIQLAGSKPRRPLSSEEKYRKIPNF